MTLFRVYGKPAQQGSKRLVNLHGKPRMIEDNDARKKSWRNAVATAAAEEMNGTQVMTGPLALIVTFLFQRPAAHYGTGKNAGWLKDSAPEHHSQTPDLDKLLRCATDAMTGIVYRDDKQIVRIVAERRWTDQQEGAVIDVQELAPQSAQDRHHDAEAALCGDVER